MVWDRTYGGINDDEVWSLIQTTDGGYAVVWGTYSYGVGGRDFWVIKLNSRGNKLWDKTYGGSNVDYYAESLIQTNDGGYVIAGISYSKGAGADAQLIKVDEKGNQLWDKTFGSGKNDWKSEWAKSIIQTNDGGYAVAGWIESKGAGEGDFWLLKLDSEGNLLWDHTYGGSNDDWATSIIQTNDGGYALAGYTESKGVWRDVWIFKLDEQGNLK